MQIVEYAFWFIVAIGVLVTVHEYGHFWVARRLGVKVLRFSIGFGRPLWSRRAGPDRTEYVVAAIPLGGYVKMLDENEGAVEDEERHRAFNCQPLWKRIAIVVAGPAANFLFAIFAYWLIFVIGIGGVTPVIGKVDPDGAAAAAGLAPGQRIIAVDGRETHTWRGVWESVIGATLKGRHLELQVEDAGADNRIVRMDLQGKGIDEFSRGQMFDVLGLEPRPVPPVIGDVTGGSPAERGGLQDGDRVLSVNGEKVPSWREFVKVIRDNAEEPLELRVERDGAAVSLVITPARITTDGTSHGQIGAYGKPLSKDFAGYYGTTRYGPLEAVGKAAGRTWDMTVMTLRILWKMVTLQVSFRHISGPISIAKYAGMSADAGLIEFLGLLAIVSISLGILNLLPIPLLDGGHLLYYLIESVTGRPLSEEAQFLGQRVGIVMLMCLMVLAFYNDIVRLVG